MATPAIDRNRIITNHFNKYQRDREKYPEIHDIVLVDDNLDNWYVIVRNVYAENREFLKKGEFIFKLHMAKEVPHKPPSIAYLTETGIYNLNSTICMSIGSYHPEKFAPAMGITGYAALAISVFPYWEDLEHGVSVINKPKIEDIKKFTFESKRFNLKNNKKILMNSKWKDDYVKYEENVNKFETMVKKFSKILLKTEHGTTFNTFNRYFIDDEIMDACLAYDSKVLDREKFIEQISLVLKQNWSVNGLNKATIELLDMCCLIIDGVLTMDAILPESEAPPQAETPPVKVKLTKEEKEKAKAEKEAAKEAKAKAKAEKEAAKEAKAKLKEAKGKEKVID